MKTYFIVILDYTKGKAYNVVLTDEASIKLSEAKNVNVWIECNILPKFNLNNNNSSYLICEDAVSIETKVINKL
ncbi:MAG: hypothetical protein RSE41_00445 [Clostridia bacterium]